MNTTLRHISHLLRSCDLLVVPGLGVFSRRRIDARICDGVLIAPTSELTFIEMSETSSNRELILSIARSLAIEPEKAEMRMRDEIAEIRQYLLAGRTISIPETGELRQNGSRITFEAYAASNSQTWLSWIGNVEPLVEIHTPEPEEEEIEENRRTFLQSLRRTTSSAAAIALLALIAFVASQLPGHRSDDQTRIATMGIERLDSHAPEVMQIENPMPEKALVLIVNTPSDGMCIVEPHTSTREKASEVESCAKDSYFLVVASLASRNEADRFIAAQPGDIALSLLEEDGRFRVYAASGTTFARTKAIADSNGIFDRYPQAWICKSARN